MMTKTPIRFWLSCGYRPFTRHWWTEIVKLLSTGWWKALSTFWHRGRYGWAPRDTWSLDHYLSQVMAGALVHLADHTHGVPVGYPSPDGGGDDSPEGVERAFTLWQGELRRWAKVFEDYARGEDIDLQRLEDAIGGTGRPIYLAAWEADAQRRDAAVQLTLQEMAPWWGALWD